MREHACVCSLSYPTCTENAPYYMSSAACMALRYFSTLSHKRYDCRNELLNTKCVLSPELVRFFNQIWIFFTDFRKKLKYQISSKSVQWEPSCSRGRTDGQTDLTKLIVAFLNFAIARRDEKGKSYCVISSSLVGSSCHIQFALGAHALLHNCTLNVHNRLKPLWWIFNYHDSFIFYGSITTFEKPG